MLTPIIILCLVCKEVTHSEFVEHPTYFLIERTKKMLARKKSSPAPKVVIPQKTARIDVLIINSSCRYIFNEMTHYLLKYNHYKSNTY